MLADEGEPFERPVPRPACELESLVTLEAQPQQLRQVLVVVDQDDP